MEKGNDASASGATATQPGSASGVTGTDPGVGTGTGTGTNASGTSGGGQTAGAGGSTTSQGRRPIFDDGWTYDSGTPPPGYEGLTPEEEIAELEEGISNLNRNGQNAWERGSSEYGELWERAGEMRKRQNHLQRQLGLPESGPPKASP